MNKININLLDEGSILNLKLIQGLIFISINNQMYNYKENVFKPLKIIGCKYGVYKLNIFD